MQRLTVKAGLIKNIVREAQCRELVTEVTATSAEECRFDVCRVFKNIIATYVRDPPPPHTLYLKVV